MANLTLAVLIAIVVSAAVADVRTRRIPKALTGTLAAFAIAVNVPAGWANAALALAIMAIAFVIGTIAFSFKILGGGDVKLLAGCCGVAGVSGSATFLFYMACAGGALAIFDAARARKLRPLLVSTFHLASHRLAPSSLTTQATIPYGVAIAIGSCAYALSVSAFPALRISL